MYFKRHAEESVKELSGMFGATLVTGARQTGKTTLLEKLFPDIPGVTLDDDFARISAGETPSTFLNDYAPPVFIDEVQHAPALFPGIKKRIDQQKKKGMYLMTGLEQFALMEQVSESLSGRVGIQVLPGLSLREKKKKNFLNAFLPTDLFFEQQKKYAARVSYDEIWEEIWRGDLPELYANRRMDWARLYGAYVRTYIERDVRKLTQVGDERKFMVFMTAVASMTGSLLNLSELARDVGISQPTADRWLSVLVASHLVYLLMPFHTNITKRMVKTPKLYLLNTGLAAYLTKWNNPDVLKNGAMAGSLFETFVVSEIIKSYYNRGVLDLPLYFYRDNHKNEIDLLIEENGTLHPLEIKKNAEPRSEDIRLFSVLDDMPRYRRGTGGLICMYDEIASLDDRNKVIPAWCL